MEMGDRKAQATISAADTHPRVKAQGIISEEGGDQMGTAAFKAPGTTLVADIDPTAVEGIRGRAIILVVVSTSSESTRGSAPPE